MFSAENNGWILDGFLIILEVTSIYSRWDGNRL